MKYTLRVPKKLEGKITLHVAEPNDSFIIRVVNGETVYSNRLSYLKFTAPNDMGHTRIFGEQYSIKGICDYDTTTIVVYNDEIEDTESIDSCMSENIKKCIVTERDIEVEVNALLPGLIKSIASTINSDSTELCNGIVINGKSYFIRLSKK